MIISELTNTDITKLISMLSEEIAALGVRIKSYPQKSVEIQKAIRENEAIIEKLEKMS